MMPRTHFITGLLVAAIINIFFPLKLSHYLLSAFFATIIDLDHLIVYYSHHKKISFQGTWATSIKGAEHQRSVLHQREGIVLFSIIALFFSLFQPLLSIIFYCSTISHIIMDKIQFKKEHKKFSKILKWEYPISREEIILDISLIILLMILTLFHRPALSL